MPVLAIGGDHSFDTTMAHIMRFAADDVHEAVIEDSGHWLMEEQPEATVTVIRGFLDGGATAALPPKRLTLADGRTGAPLTQPAKKVKIAAVASFRSGRGIMTNRRSFLRGASVLLGPAAFGQVMTAFAAAPRKATFFTDAEMATLRALVDVILPATDSPAASAADTHYFIDLAIPACASARGAEDLPRGAAALGSQDFAKLDAATQVGAAQGARRGGHGAPTTTQSFFKILKDYTLTGYFLSEDRRDAGAGVRTSAGRILGRPAARAQPESVGDLMAATNQLRRDRRRLRHVRRLGREGADARRA